MPPRTTLVVPAPYTATRTPLKDFCSDFESCSNHKSAGYVFTPTNSYSFAVGFVASRFGEQRPRVIHNFASRFVLFAVSFRRVLLLLLINGTL